MTTMTQAQPARGSDPAPAAGPVAAPRRRSGRIGGLYVGQLVALEVAALAVALSLGRPVWIVAVVGTASALALGAAFARRHGRWWFEHLLVNRRFKRRVRRSAVAARSRTRSVPAPLAALAPDLRIAQITDRGHQVGIGQDGEGFFVAMSVSLPRPAPHALPVPVLERLAAVTTGGNPASALQIVVHTVPGPSALLHRSAPAVQSYLELLNGESVPATRQIWVVVRLDPRDARAAAAARGGGIDGVHRALTAFAGRVGKALRGGGVDYRVLDAAGLTAAIATAAGLTGTATPQEEWERWVSGESGHLVYALTGLPPRSLSALLQEIAQPPLTSTTVAVRMAPAPEGALALSGVLRIAAPPDGLEQVGGWVRGRADQIGVTMHRLDGQQAVGVYAAAPTAAETL
ncbi:type VII secretion protein EccE [Actinoplanes teichomyceticus]|uniref:Type VII secretion protein EccE n=1 Tax=Actinoplanes teichomyceticus TaxID=1867 RepID=A0A561WBA5_ACTTI|nr:type VII secretion protein EccE [Actinoplanes teichomyceticus]TWG21133.1 type VII secretion protein EccE [Actinoplanes teichomyceticus]GIF14954.1 type VII secretion protein EccE [Actinoplanes teichomyceticus]